VLVIERKTRALSRLLTTSIRRIEILLGHYLAMFAIIFVQLLLLTVFGQLFLKLDYYGAPLATFFLSIATALAAASLGLLIGTLANNEDQVIIYTLIPMFVLSGLGGAWVPLEITPAAVQRIGHLSPVAWIMDGYKGILIRGAGLNETLIPIAVLLGFAALFAALAVWRFRFE
jgi:ABC-2 type transport system permease protein